MYRATFLIFASAVLGFYALLWGTALRFQESAASAIALVAIIALGIPVIQPRAT